MVLRHAALGGNRNAQRKRARSRRIEASTFYKGSFDGPF